MSVQEAPAAKFGAAAAAGKAVQVIEIVSKRRCGMAGWKRCARGQGEWVGGVDGGVVGPVRSDSDTHQNSVELPLVAGQFGVIILLAAACFPPPNLGRPTTTLNCPGVLSPSPTGPTPSSLTRPCTPSYRRQYHPIFGDIDVATGAYSAIFSRPRHGTVQVILLVIHLPAVSPTRHDTSLQMIINTASLHVD